MSRPIGVVAIADSNLKFKTKPFKQQLEALRRSKDAKVFALLMEQGTGKSKVIIDTAAHLWRGHKIDMLFVIAPKGVAPGWIRQQIPTHMPDDIPYIAGLWKAGMSQTRARELSTVLKATDRLRIIIMNIEAFGATEDAIDFAITGLDAAMSALLVVDECFPAGTKVRTPSGERPIESIKVGELISTSVGPKPVTNVFLHKSKTLAELKLSNGQTILCTPTHLLWSDIGWVEARASTGQTLLHHQEVRLEANCAGSGWREPQKLSSQRPRQEKTRFPGTVRVDGVTHKEFRSEVDVWDLEVEGVHHFFAEGFLVHNSHRIKTPGAHSTKRITNLRNRSAYRRILTGTIGDKPFDVFSQFGFLDPAILQPDVEGNYSFTTFKAEYAELQPDTSGLMRHIALRIPKKWSGKYIDDMTGQPEDGAFNFDGTKRQKHMVPAYLPTIVALNPDGTPKYKNLERLQQLIAPYSYRVLKVDCLDLPGKLYGRWYTEMSPLQWKLYKQIRDQLRLEYESGQIVTFNKLTAILRLQQVVCGYVLNEEQQLVCIFDSWRENPRILSMLDYIEHRPEKEGTIIWCRFIEDIRQVTAALRDRYGAKCAVQFYGEVNEVDRETAVARFQGERQIMDKSGNLIRNEPIPPEQRARFMVAQQRAGGVGQTWTAANLSFHYSNSFSLIDRLQAEDRPHRIGQEHPVQYTDIEAEDTVDSTIIDSLIAKKDVADVINNDPTLSWLRVDAAA